MASVEMQRTGGEAARNTNTQMDGAASSSSSSSSSGPVAASSLSLSSPATVTLVMSRGGGASLSPLCDYYRSYLSTHLESGEVWYLLSLALLADGAFDECLLAVRECLKRHPDDVPALLLASQLCLNKLKRYKESVEYSSRALRCIKQQMQQRQQQAGLIAMAAARAASESDAPSVPTSIGALASTSLAAPSSSSSSFGGVSQHPQVEASLLLTCQMLFGLSCSKYAYHVSTFSNRKSLQKRALHALETAYNQQPAVATAAAATPAAASNGVGVGSVAPPGSGNKKLSFYLACLYADIREIGRALSILKRCLYLDRGFGPCWNLLALLLSSQKKYVSAIRACDNGLAQLTGSLPLTPPSPAAMEAGVVDDVVKNSIPLLLTKARLQSHTGHFDEALATFSQIISVTFEPATVHVKSMHAHTTRGGGGGAGSLVQRPVFRPTRSREESTEMRANARTDQRSVPEVEWATTRVQVLLALAQLYAAHATGQSQTGGASSGAGGLGLGLGLGGSPSSPVAVPAGPVDESLLHDAFDCVYVARELAPTSLLPDIHASLASLCALASRPALAVRHYENALVLDSQHTDALIGLARIENQRASSGANGGGNLVLAYGYLMSALQVDATAHAAWFEMALILQSQGKPSAAAEHFLTALELEKTAPIASFDTIRREFV